MTLLLASFASHMPQGWPAVARATSFGADNPIWDAHDRLGLLSIRRKTFLLQPKDTYVGAWNQTLSRSKIEKDSVRLHRAAEGNVNGHGGGHTALTGPLGLRHGRSFTKKLNLDHRCLSAENLRLHRLR